MGAFNWSVRDVSYSKVDKDIIGRNLHSEWVWDDNNFEVNQIGHPIQGSVYYSIARANGHGYAGGLVYTALGSIQWEYCMETERPAINDLITTTMGGAMIGETTWRLSELLSGESTGEQVGWLRRTGAYLINPAFGIDRLVNGSPKRSVKQKNAKLLGLRIASGRSLGGNFTKNSGAEEKPTPRTPIALTNLGLVHGDPFEAETPFDHFTVNLGLSFRTYPVANASITGQLWQTPEYETRFSRHIFVAVQNYDYIHSPIYRISANSLGVEWLSETPFDGGWEFWTHLQPFYTVLGAASTEYYVNVQRDYNLGMGGGWKAGIVLRKEGFGMIRLTSDRYWIHTQSGASGDEIIDIHSGEIEKEIGKGFGIGGAYVVYNRSGYYNSYPHVNILNHEFRILGTYSL